MCLTIPGKIIEIKENIATVSYGDELRQVESFLDVNVGDYVVVSNKIIIKKIPKEDAILAIDLFKNIK